MRALEKHFFLPLVMFLFVVPMQVDLGGARVNTSLAAMALLAVAYLADQLLGRRPLGREHRLFALLGALLIWFLGVAVAGEARDFLAVQMCVYGIIMYAGALVLARRYGRHYGAGAPVALLKTLFALGLAHAAIQFAVLVLPAVSDAVYGVVALSENSAAHISQGYRSPGLFSSGAAILGTFNAWILAIGLVAHLRLPGRAPVWRVLALSVAAIVEIAAIAISGRTGFVALLICLLVIGAYEVVSDPRSRLGRNVALALLASAVIVAAGALTVSVDNIRQNLRWSFEFIYSISEGNGLATSSTSVLFQQMFFLPEGWFPLLFGTSNFGRSPDFPYVDSDAGYVLMMYGGGIVGTLLMTSVFAFIFGEALRSRTHPLVVLLLAFVGTILVVNVKDFYFIQNSGVSQLLLLCFAALVVMDEPVRARAGAAAGIAIGGPGRRDPRPGRVGVVQ
jgi:hypothetical protein